MSTKSGERLSRTRESWPKVLHSGQPQYSLGPGLVPFSRLSGALAREAPRRWLLVRETAPALDRGAWVAIAVRHRPWRARSRRARWPLSGRHARALLRRVTAMYRILEPFIPRRADYEFYVYVGHALARMKRTPEALVFLENWRADYEIMCRFPCVPLVSLGPTPAPLFCFELWTR